DEVDRLLIGVPWCQSGWDQDQGRCYLFSRANQTWEAARNSCLAQNADLVVINDQMEQNRTMSRVYWLGLSDQKVESQWLWVDGSPLKLSFLSTGEPNDSSNEDYGTMAIDGCWNDINCYMTDYWICKKPWFCYSLTELTTLDLASQCSNH
uniref:C-type lectin domain-containing protein n=1 Tax=Gopherus evgoodei TaxID=1825980 RepID=A0A8C4YPP3_9SAUR